MFYKESCGLPLIYHEHQNYKDVFQDRREYFLSLVVSIEKSLTENPTRRVILFTKLSIINLSKTQFVATITFIDGKGRAKKFGGDYLRARSIHDSTKNPNGISG